MSDDEKTFSPRYGKNVGLPELKALGVPWAEFARHCDWWCTRKAPVWKRSRQRMVNHRSRLQPLVGPRVSEEDAYIHFMQTVHQKGAQPAASSASEPVAIAIAIAVPPYDHAQVDAVAEHKDAIIQQLRDDAYVASAGEECQQAERQWRELAQSKSLRLVQAKLEAAIATIRQQEATIQEQKESIRMMQLVRQVQQRMSQKRPAPDSDRVQ
jgi:hypothetical protein